MIIDEQQLEDLARQQYLKDSELTIDELQEEYDIQQMIEANKSAIHPSLIMLASI